MGTLRPKYLLYGYMEPSGSGLRWQAHHRPPADRVAMTEGGTATVDAETLNPKGFRVLGFRVYKP